MKKIAVIGYKGKMGSCVFEKISHSYQVVGIDVNDSIAIAKHADIVVDFSTGANSAKTAIWCAKQKIPLIIGATGQNNKENKVIIECAKKIPILKAGNFSIGIAILKKMLLHLKLCNIDSVSILEKHHKLKRDKPSGTALELETYLKKFYNIEIDINAVRGGREIGMHEISIYFGDEVLSLRHQAFSRNAFVEGVMLAIKFMLNIKDSGLYNFEDII